MGSPNPMSKNVKTVKDIKILQSSFNNKSILKIERVRILE